ncbi:trimeric intracellular cation channel family protein [Mesobacillus jeotgali]|uniref:trimeric intracellular cation channel family protein n=1 Tax=Mesobacillus jeotgali TaxID=129985 RepID=UPI0009A7AF8F|nr:trimeric intracellular cation channel family protein [Mesobacillus jeotgali]
MTWEILNIIGTLAFAISGALVAREEDYDLIGVYVLGFTTAFGGGMIRNLLIGLPIEHIWKQEYLFEFAFLAMTIAFGLPNKWIDPFKKSVVFFDAIGLAAFAIQGAKYAVSIDAPLIAVIIAAVMTGTGGGMIRDVFAGRKPMIFHSEIYALWAAMAGITIGSGLVEGPYATPLLFIAIVLFRIISVYFNWNLPQNIQNRNRSFDKS